MSAGGLLLSLFVSFACTHRSPSCLFSSFSQRYQHKLKHHSQHSTLSNEREDLLTNIGFIWDSHAASWQEQFQTLQDFFATHGHCNVPTHYLGSTALNVWCKHQRKQHKLFKSGRNCTLTQTRVDCLNSIKFNWSPRQPQTQVVA